MLHPDLTSLSLILENYEDFNIDNSQSQSPNNIKYIFVGNKGMQSVKHLENPRKTMTWVYPEGFEETDGLTYEMVENFFEDSARSIQNIEGVFTTAESTLGNLVKEYVFKKYNDRRLKYLGTVPNVNFLFDEEGNWVEGESGLPEMEAFSLIGEGGLREGHEWWNHIGYRPEYTLDVKIKEKLEKEKDRYVIGENEGEEENLDLFEEEEVIEKVEEKSVTEKPALKYYEPSIRGTVEKILGEYDKIFASGYELIKPCGLLVKIDSGKYRLISLDAENKVQEEQSKIINHLGKVIDERMNLSYSLDRGMVKIAENLAKRRTGLQENLYFPYKLLEYAYGRKHCLDDSAVEKGVYESHSTAKDWWKYREEEVKNSLLNLTRNLVDAIMKNNALEEEYESDEAEELVGIALDNVLKSMTCCIMVSVYDIFKGVPAKLKVRVLDSYGRLREDSENIATKVFWDSLNNDGGKDANSAPVVRKGIFWEFTHEYNHTMANAEPIFASQALKALREKGETVSWDNLILGKDSDDNILKASPTPGMGISFFSNLLHWCVAGSRSGKGVMTMNKTTGILMSRRALFYLDDKPDVGSLLKYLGPNGFIINGPSISYDKESGFDYYKQFINADTWLNPNRIPGYLIPNVFSERTYSQMGGVVYLRGMLLTMGIILARVKARDKLHLLGGEEGIAIIYDELANASEKFNAWYYGNVRGNLANTGYAEEFVTYNKANAEYEEKLREWEENGENGPKPRRPEKIKSPVVYKHQYWFTSLYNSIATSFAELYSESRAGLRNIEANVSDIFALTQELPRVAEVGSNPEDLLVKRNKTDNNPNSSAKNTEILASLIGVSGMDGFFGYNANWKNVLGQKNQGTIAFDKLDSKARNFAYVSEVTTSNYDAIVNGHPSESEKAIYFKPFLLLIEGNEPFTTKAQEYVEGAGLDWGDIVRRNETEPGSGMLDPAIGYKGYLNELGMSDAEIAETLGKSGTIAQNVVNAMGYEGTWNEFLHDMRPEWIFSVKDVREAMQGIPLKGKYRKDIDEFISVYPEEFPNVVRPGESKGIESNGDVGGDGSIPIQWVNHYSGDSGVEADAIPEELLESGENVGFVPEQVSGLNSGMGVGMDEKPASHLFTGTGEVPNDLRDTQVLNYGGENTFNPEENIGRNDWEDLGTVGIPRESSLDEATIKAIVTQTILNKYPLESIKRLTISGGVLSINGRPVGLSFPQNLLRVVGSVYAAKLGAGLVAELFNWGLFDEMDGLEALKVDSVKFFRGTMLREAGISTGKDGGVTNTFNSLDNLKKLNLGGKVFTREGLEDQVAGKGFVESLRNQYTAERNAFIFTTWSARQTGRTYNWTRGKFRSGQWVRGLLGVAGVGVGTAVTGASGLTGALIEGMRSVKYALNETFGEQ